MQRRPRRGQCHLGRVLQWQGIGQHVCWHVRSRHDRVAYSNVRHRWPLGRVWKLPARCGGGRRRAHAHACWRSAYSTPAPFVLLVCSCRGDMQRLALWGQRHLERRVQWQSCRRKLHRHVCHWHHWFAHRLMRRGWALDGGQWLHARCGARHACLCCWSAGEAAPIHHANVHCLHRFAVYPGACISSPCNVSGAAVPACRDVPGATNSTRDGRQCSCPAGFGYSEAAGCQGAP